MRAAGRGTAVAGVALIVVGAGALLYAPDNKTAVKVAILVAGVVIGMAGWLWARIRRR